MPKESDEETARGAPKRAESRQARLEQALRANLLKRKEKAKADKASRTPPEEGGQAEG